MSALTVPVLLGSVRRDRMGIRAAHLVTNALAARGHNPVLVLLPIPRIGEALAEDGTGDERVCGECCLRRAVGQAGGPAFPDRGHRHEGRCACGRGRASFG